MNNIRIPPSPPNTSENSSDVSDVLWLHLLIELISRMNDSDDEAKNDLLQLWRMQYEGVEEEQRIIDEFERDFEPSRAVWWYTRECGLYRLLQRAFQQMDFHVIVTIRLIIKYLYRQLSEEHQQLRNDLIQNAHSTILRVYRSEAMKINEFEILKTKIGQLHSVKSLFITSLDRKVALSFSRAMQLSSDCVSICFEIDIDTTLSLLSYIQVSHLSYSTLDTDGVLLMLGTIYVVNSIHYDSDVELWIVKASLCGENDYRLKDIIDYIKYELKDTTNFITLADLFVKMGEYDTAKVYYEKYQGEPSANDPNRKRAWNGLSELADIQGNFCIAMKQLDKAHQYFKEQLDICKQLPPHHPQYGKCYSNIANLYEIEEKKDVALKYYKKNIGQSTATKPNTLAGGISGVFEDDADAADTTSTNLETFLIVWLDANVTKTQDNLDTYTELRAAVNYIKTFDELQKCEEYILRIKREKIILIVSGGLGREIVPRLHDLVQLNCIYVFCMDQEANEEWSKNYSKVRSVITEREELIEKVSKDQTLRNIIEDPVPMSISKRTSIVKELTAKDVSKAMGAILWFQLLIEVLLRMPHAEDAKRDLLQTWKENYSGNPSELEIIDAFEHQYTKENAIWWYTRECSLYRILNKALREQSIDIMLLFRFFMSELSKQMSELYSDQNLRNGAGGRIIHVYRGQTIAKEEFEQMQQGIGGFISINSFFSTSMDESNAIRFAKVGAITEQTRIILFRIKIDSRLPTKPYADIERFSFYQGEKEILFMLGCIFRIDNVTYDDNDKLWILDLSLCSDDDFELEEVFSYMKKDIGEETSMITLGNILVKMGEYDKAERIFLKIDHKDGLIQVMEQKGNYYLAIKNYQRAIDYYEKVLELRHQCYPPPHPEIGKSFVSLAMAYEFQKHYTNAMDYYDRAIKQYKRTMKENHPLVIQTKNNLQKLQTTISSLTGLWVLFGTQSQLST
ncbi:unnamed protein product [Didymodactylos carnosus]|uniref:ADP ribosyltransferase domain-containing protein n=1 Tax=Didymodactylos carnosus TaxID=1234261 RepID=A0A814L0C9_9BILA|nr:unnamed protein product [Didymodactylos carnosus]CAF3827185.1 unnamed protein product [Didymodactylos carnosus]